MSPLLSAHRFREAALAVAAFEARQPLPRGIGINWEKYDPTHSVVALEGIFSNVPGILRGVEPSALDTLRFAAAMMLLWGSGKPRRSWIARDFATGTRFTGDQAARMLLFAGFHARNIEQLRDFARFGGNPRARIMTVGNGCDSCRQLSQQTYALASIPELPHPNCTFPGGCRCSVTASMY